MKCKYIGKRTFNVYLVYANICASVSDSETLDLRYRSQKDYTGLLLVY